MSGSVALNEMEAIREALAEVEWARVDRCRFRRSGSGNIVGSDGNGDVFVVGKGGVVIDVRGMSRPDDPPIVIRFSGEPKGSGLISGRLQDLSERTLDAESIAPQAQGELNASREGRLNAHVEKYSVRAAGSGFLEVTPVAVSRFVNAFYPIRIDMRRGESMTKMLRRLKETVAETEFEACLSEQCREEIRDRLEEDARGDRALRAPENLLPYVKGGRFLEWANSDSEEAMPSRAVMKNDGRLVMRFLDQEIVLNMRGGDVTMRGIGKAKRLASFARRNRRKLEACLNVVRKRIPSSFEIRDGSVCGYVTAGGRKIRFRFADGEISARGLAEAASDAERAEREKRRKATENALRKVRESSLYGSAVTAGFADLLAKNPKGVTAREAVNRLRGVGRTRKDAKPSCYEGVFGLIPEETIMEEIKAVVEQGFAEKTGKSGKARLRPTLGIEGFVTYAGSPSGKAIADLTDFDWLTYVRREILFPSKRREKEELALLDHPAAFCLDPDATAAFMAKKPEYWTDYVETMRSAETGTAKRYWRAVAEAVAEKKAERKRRLSTEAEDAARIEGSGRGNGDPEKEELS